MGVYLSYVSRQGYSLVNGQLFVPEGWFDGDHAAYLSHRKAKLRQLAVLTNLAL